MAIGEGTIKLNRTFSNYSPKHPRIILIPSPAPEVATIKLLQDRGLVVGMVGDGGNDCGALRSAHVGLALYAAPMGCGCVGENEFITFNSYVFDFLDYDHFLRVESYVTF